MLLSKIDFYDFIISLINDAKMKKKTPNDRKPTINIEHCLFRQKWFSPQLNARSTRSKLIVACLSCENVVLYQDAVATVLSVVTQFLQFMRFG